MIPLKSILVLLVPLKALACGLDWSPPVSHFENVDYQGNVHIVRKLGEVEKLPIYLIFNSTNGVSPYVGSGFEIPFLESRVWQVDENRFQMKSPSGWLWVFQRTKDRDVLEGNAGWKGLIKDDLITVWAPCGDKIVFKNGRIVSMKLKNDDFSYIYRNGRVASLERNGRALLEVKTNSKTGDVSGISLPASREEIGLDLSGERPFVGSIAGRTLVTRLERTLSGVTNSVGDKEIFHQVVNDEMTPTIQTERTVIAWNPISKRILTEGEWTYNIKPGVNYQDNAAIGRKNEQGQSEFWHYNSAKGEETTQRITGVKKATTWFTTGLLAGKIRLVDSGEGYYRYTYDEHGRLLRVVRPSGAIDRVKYVSVPATEAGNLVKVDELYDAGKVCTLLDDLGRVRARFAYASGAHHTFSYTQDGSAKLEGDGYLDDPPEWARIASISQQ